VVVLLVVDVVEVVEVVLVVEVVVEVVEELVVVVVGRQPFTYPQNVVFSDTFVEIAVRNAVARLSGQSFPSIVENISVTHPHVSTPKQGRFGPVYNVRSVLLGLTPHKSKPQSS
jgi:hypothetical protein